ncbi:MraY family glycosyltransferase [Zoogloea sp.]|uniref:MraY family glycosyltransferase n=1 Tax=Zoogloea sp. TaxID=49181 RepID=UPI0026106D57|nr:MraY family glycosyltransferase [Zoogloea sp.]MDD3352747.1 MraY family glycosyltransferase [Zoogloea sp.]
MVTALLFLLGFVVSAVAIRYAIHAAFRFNIVDKPGGHKAHTHVTPAVGGAGILAANLLALGLVGYFNPEFGTGLQALGVGMVIMFAVGFLDDLFALGYRIRLAIQAGVALLMIFWGGVMLQDLGYLAADGLVGLGWVGVPLTMVATIGAINALNMIDGIDGLSGSISTISLLLIGLALMLAGDWVYLSLVLIMAGGVAGFLFYNLRYRGQRRARCFMGDNGSMQLGFLFAWLLTDLCQADVSGRVFSPVTTLWLFAVPLIDTLSVMLRRLWMKRSPFRPDRHHLHHLFLRAGFRVQDTVLMLAMAQLLFGAIGLGGMYAGISELGMFIAFGLAFGGIFLVLLRPWRFVPLLRRFHRRLGFTSVHAVGVHVSGLDPRGLGECARKVNALIGADFDFRFTAYRTFAGREECYGIIELVGEEEDLPVDDVRKIIIRLRRELKRDGLKVRQYIQRDDAHDRRVGGKLPHDNRRQAERRAQIRRPAIFRVLSAAGEPCIQLAFQP